MKLKFTKRNIIIAVIVLTAAFIASLFFTTRHAAPIAQPHKNTLVKLSPVKIHPVPVVISATAELLPSAQVSITPQTAGYVKSIHFVEGAYVKKGRVLVQLDDRQQKNKVAQAKAVYNLSKESYERNNRLKKNFAISAQDLDKLKSQLEQDRALLNTAKTTLSNMTLTAPFSGFLGEKNISVGDYVQPGTQLVTLTDTQHLKVSYNVPARYANQLHLNQPVKIITNSAPEQFLYGKVNYVAPTVNEDNQTFAVHALLINHQNTLKPGEFVSVKQKLGQISQAVLVPEDAILGNINGYYVLQVKGNKVYSTSIEPGEHYQNEVVILSGLKRGDKIITAGQHQVKAGDLVRIARVKK